MQRLRNTKKGLRYFIPTALIVIGLILTGLSLANPSDVPRVSATEVKSSRPVQPYNQQNVPKVGEPFKFGSYIIDDNSPKPVEDLLGQKMELVGWYTKWTNPLAGQKLKNTCTQNYVPVITWESWASSSEIYDSTFDLADIAAGKYDSKIKQELASLNKACPDRTVIMRFDHEMNTPQGEISWYPWQGDTQNYIAAWQRIVTISHATSPNIKWLWSPSHTTDQDVADIYYPGDQYVDYVGLSLNKADNNPEFPQSFAAFYEESRAKIESFNKPVIVAETVIVEGENTDRKADWIRGMFSYAKHRRIIVGILYFNEVSKREGIPKNSNLFNSSPTSLQAFRESLAAYRSKQ